MTSAERACPRFQVHYTFRGAMGLTRLEVWDAPNSEWKVDITRPVVVKSHLSDLRQLPTGQQVVQGENARF
ncbi:MAG: hypothetical protein Kow0063_05580 [Anaerolineae bacterium]